jgi:hypothetical protein
MTYGEPDAPLEFKGVAVVRESVLAILCRGLTAKAIWVPKSVIHADSEISKMGQNGNLRVKLWWAERTGLVSKQAVSETGEP